MSFAQYFNMAKAAPLSRLDSQVLDRPLPRSTLRCRERKPRPANTLRPLPLKSRTASRSTLSTATADTRLPHRPTLVFGYLHCNSSMLHRTLLPIISTHRDSQPLSFHRRR